MPSNPEKALVGLLLGEELFVVAVDRLIDIVRDPSVQSVGASARPVLSWRGVPVHAIDLSERIGVQRGGPPQVAAIVSVAGRVLGILASGVTRVSGGGAAVAIELRELLGRST